MGNGFDALSQVTDTLPDDHTTTSAEPLISYPKEYEPALTEVLSRTKVADGIICTLNIPQTNSNKLSNGQTYEQFGIPVKGGYINFHLFDRNKCAMHGKRLVVECEVWHKTMSGGREHMYIDLRPSDAQPTHERKVWQDGTSVPTDLPVDTQVHMCLGGTKGVIAFLPL